jgi:predicted CXXCH cytochrome family protein
MELLLRRSVNHDGRETVDHALTGKALVLGGVEGCDFLIPGLATSITIGARAAGLSLKSKTAAFEVAGKRTRRVNLAAGERVSIHGLELCCFAPPSGFDAGLEVIGEPDTGVRNGLVQEIQPWSMRRLSWTLAIILSLFLVIPLLTRLEPLSGLQSVPGLPDDSLWTSGPLAAAHHAAGLSERCDSCHEKPFRMVTDGTCLTCHAQTHEHMDPQEFPTLAMQETRCASCHREHNEPEWLVHSNDRLCAACHADPAPWRRAGSDVPHSVTGFSADGHPEFRLSMWQPQAQNAALGWELRRTRTPPAQLEDRSGLKFNHAVHLDVDKVSRGPNEEALVCASCHRLEDDGEHFAALSMDGECRACHELNFDPFDPDIELPHGNTRATFEAMEAHFIREFTDPVLRAERVQQKPRRLPGKRMSAASCEGDGLSCGRQEAEREAAYQFADTGCVTCHEVSDSEASAAIDRWTIHPVKLTLDWYSQSRFDHSSHLSVDGATGDEVCQTCHDAAASESGRDVLIPGLDNCVECHGTQARRAPSECIACHQLHRDGAPTVAVTRAEVRS